MEAQSCHMILDLLAGAIKITTLNVAYPTMYLHANLLRLSHGTHKAASSKQQAKSSTFEFLSEAAQCAMSALRRRHAAPTVEADAKGAAPTAAAPSQRRREDVTNQRLASVFLALIAAAIYANTLTAEFCYDDTFAVVNNKDVTGVNPISALWRHDFWGQNITKV